MKQKHHIRMRIFLIFLDIVTMFAGFFSAYWLSNRVTLLGIVKSPDIPFPLFILLVALSATMMLLLMAWQGAYRPDINHLKLDNNRLVIRGVFMSSAFFFIPFFYIQHLTDTRLLLTLAIIIVPSLLFLQKTLIAAVLSKRFDHPVSPRRLLIMGYERDGSSLLRKAFSSWDPGYKPIGFIGPEKNPAVTEISTGSLGLRGRVPVLGTYDQLEQTLKNWNIEELWINDPHVPQENLLDTLAVCHRNHVRVGVIPAIGNIPAIMVDAVNVGGQMLLREKRALVRPIYDVQKRIIDLLASSLGLIIFSPVFLIVGILIRLDSRGPVFFKQTRIGKAGKPFLMYKFRSMRTDSSPYEESPNTKVDPRITRMGRILRRTSLDELPQLINVFLGSMSLVGPRPEMPFIVEQYNRFQRRRLAVKPGITGLWQISADRSIPIHQNMDYDLYYIDNRSLITDMVIIWRTIWTAMYGI